MMRKEKPEGFVPLFKERTDKEQFLFDDAKWVKTNEATVMAMWYAWGVRKDGTKYQDEEGFTVYGYIKNKEE
jgi:hypothetical protein